jgi:hypothetical protein
VAAQIEQPTHIQTYELSGEITQKTLTGLEQTRDKLGTFDIEGLNIED